MAGSSGGRLRRAVAGIEVGSRRGAGHASVMYGSWHSQVSRSPRGLTCVHLTGLSAIGAPQWTHGGYDGKTTVKALPSEVVGGRKRVGLELHR